MLRIILIVLLVLLLLGALPTWPYSTGWGYYPSGGLGLILLIIIILAIAGRLGVIRGTGSRPPGDDKVWGLSPHVTLFSA